MEKLQISESSFITKFNDYFYKDRPKTSCQLYKRLIYACIVGLITLPVLLIFAVLRWINPREFNLRDGHIINFYAILQALFMCLSISFLNTKYIVHKSVLTKICATWVIIPFILFLIVIISFSIIFSIIFLIIYSYEYIHDYYENKRDLKMFNSVMSIDASPKEKKTSALKELYKSMKNKYCSKIEWID